MGIRTKKILMKIVIILVIIIFLGLVTRAIFNYTTGKKLEKAVAEMKSEGKRLTLKEFEPECDDQDNAALIWKGAEAMISMEGNDKRVLSKTIEDIFYAKAINEQTRKQLNKILSKNQNALQLIREAADKPCFKYPKNWDGPPEEIDIPNLVKMISIMRLCGIDSVFKAESSQLDEAIEQCFVGMRFSRKYLMEPFLISSLVAIANMKQLIFCLNRITAGKEIETNTLLNILTELDIDPWRRGLVWSFETEKILFIDIGIRFSGRNTAIIDAGFMDKMLYWLLRPVIKTEIVWSLKLWEEWERAAQLPYYETKHIQAMFKKKYGDIPWYFRMTGFLFPNLLTAMYKEAMLEATLLSAQIGIACKIYKNQQGEFPEKLSQLVPDILKKELLDPFTGEPFIYRRQDSGFIVYSLGSNEKDDEGRGTWAITKIVMEEDDDWAWKE